TDAAWTRFTAAGATAPTPAPARRSAVRTGGPGRWRAAVRRPAVAAMSALVLVTGAGVAAANDWLPIFRTERVDPVEITATDLVQVPDLSAFGTLEIIREPDPEQVADAATAEERTGLDVPEVDELPAGVTGDPSYTVAGTVEAVFTF